MALGSAELLAMAILKRGGDGKLMARSGGDGKLMADDELVMAS